MHLLHCKQTTELSLYFHLIIVPMGVQQWVLGGQLCSVSRQLLVPIGCAEQMSAEQCFTDAFGFPISLRV